MPSITFFWYRDEAFAWKKPVLRSPSLNQLILDRCFHMASSLSNQQFSCTLVSLKSLMISLEVGCNLSDPKCFCNWEICFLTCPKSVWFHAVSLVRHESMHKRIRKGESDPAPSSHASVTIYSHLGSLSHIDLKLNNLLGFFLFGLGRNTNSSWLWLEVEDDLWKTTVSGNFRIQSFETSALSSLSLIWTPSCLIQPRKLRPNKLHLMKPTWNNSVFKPCHLSIGPLHSTFFLIRTSNFIKISYDRPWKLAATTYGLEYSPRFGSQQCYWVPIKTGQVPLSFITAPFNPSINVY